MMDEKKSDIIRTKIILVTAFEPFGGEKLNPSKMVLEKLPNAVGGYAVRKLLLPVEFVKARELAVAEYDQLVPTAVIMLGQAGRRRAITPETTGRNVMYGHIPDNAGWKPDHLPVVENGPDKLYSTLMTDRIIRAVNVLGIPCELSDNAGEYVCNALLYRMLEHNRGAVPSGFIHVPFIREQRHPEDPFMDFKEVYRGILAAIEIVANELDQAN